ncbi:hypothetical protein KR222_008253, partial [Zaprionus bogoriensis]
MPELVGMLWSTPETKKKAPIIKVSCGIGDTDGFPAFDVESDAYDCKDDTKWGFLITGGAEFHMPLTVFQVTPNGIADKSGVRLGDIILEINEEDATQLTLAQAHERINATPKKVQFLMRNMEEDDPTGMYEAGEEKSIVMRVPKPMPPPKGRVQASSIEQRLLEMQRKLSAIAEIPKILSSTLATVSQSFGGLGCAEESYRRKCSYDEDALDYELETETETEAEEELQQQELELELHDDELRQLKSKPVKDATPESDYASEANYAPNELSDDNDSGAEEDKGEHEEQQQEQEDAEEDDEQQTVYYIRLPAARQQYSAEQVDDDADADVNVDEAEAEDTMDDEEQDGQDSDFLSTSYTWNLRNVPKLCVNDAAGACNPMPEANNAPDISKVRAATPTPVTTPVPVCLAAEAAAQVSCELLFKLDNLERAWPWADRQRIIYKQSTCHLVSRKPLGLVGQRVQLLAKQELL